MATAQHVPARWAVYPTAMKPLEIQMAVEKKSETWAGLGDTKYRFWFFDHSLTGLGSQSGVYMFVRRSNNVWAPVYVGIADDLLSRLTNHERWAEAVALGATEVVAQAQASADARQTAERNLIGLWNPALNTHHRTDRKAG